MDAVMVDIQVQLNGKFVKTLAIKDDSSKTMIENEALKATGMTFTNAKVTIFPGRVANVITL